MTGLPDFHGLHLGVRRADAERVEWCDPVPRFDRVRVLRHTCECRARVYEFCAAGGLAWVRRTDRLAAGPTVKESHPGSYGEVEKLWERLLTGEARLSTTRYRRVKRLRSARNATRAERVLRSSAVSPRQATATATNSHGSLVSSTWSSARPMPAGTVTRVNTTTALLTCRFSSSRASRLKSLISVRICS